MDGTQHDFMAVGTWQGRLYSGGWVTATGGAADVIAPGDGGTLASVGTGGPADVAAAARAARAAQPAWEATPAHKRAQILTAAAALLERHRDELMPWIIRETGSIPPKAAVEIEHSASFLRAAAAIATEPAGRILPSMDGRHEELLRVPHGVVGVISPFNFPLVLSIRAIAAGLATGNAIVHKPDPRTPVSGGIIIARIFEEAGLPAGLLHVIPGGGDVGAALCEDPDIAMVSFTGSAEVGAKVGGACGRTLKRVQLELGGKNALIILDDADLDTAVSNAAWGAWLHQGQICMATGLILAPAAMAGAVADALAAKAAHLPVGDPANEPCAMGPLITEAEAVRVKAIVDDAVAKGARLLAGGTPQGRMFPATVLADVMPGMRAFDEEIFGPVAVVVACDSDDHAVALVNRSDYGLAAGIISRDPARARAIGNRLRVGHLHINDQTVVASPLAPFGGRGRSGNGSRISGPAIWEEFTQWVWVTTRSEALATPF